MKKIALIMLTLAAVGYSYLSNNGGLPVAGFETLLAEPDALATAYKNRQSDVQVSGEGVVSRVLADDRKGSRHQRFILRLGDGQSVLIAHNIDLAPRIKGLKSGDRVEFYGEYEWNEKGGVIHWTHHDPQGRHAGGWLKHNGRTYQ